MMRRRTALTALALSATPGFAETALTADQFAAHIGTDTFRYGYNTGTRGTADYGPNRTLVWAFEGGPCFDGQWFPRGPDICFAYTDGRLSACWRFTLGPDGLQGVATERASGNLDPLTIFETSRSPEPLDCPAPDVGV